MRGLAFLCLSAILAGVPAAPPAVAAPSAAGPERTPLECRFYDRDGFYAAVGRARDYAPDGTLLGGTVPHHLLAGELIASFLQTASKNRPDVETVILIAPMHDARRGVLATTHAGWRTPAGLLEADTALADEFARILKAPDDDALMQEEHAVAALIPFVGHYFPGAKTACLLISGRAPAGAADACASLLAGYMESTSCLLVASVDFSHYLAPADTAACDEETRRAVLSGDMPAIGQMGNDNMDSPATVLTFLKTVARLGGYVTELDHGNSLEIMRLSYENPAFDEGLTSYFVFGGWAD